MSCASAIFPVNRSAVASTRRSCCRISRSKAPKSPARAAASVSRRSSGPSIAATAAISAIYLRKLRRRGKCVYHLLCMSEKLALLPEDFSRLAQLGADFVADYYASLANRPVFVPSTAEAPRKLLEEPLPQPGAAFPGLLDVIRDVV